MINKTVSHQRLLRNRRSGACHAPGTVALVEWPSVALRVAGACGAPTPPRWWWWRGASVFEPASGGKHLAAQTSSADTNPLHLHLINPPQYSSQYLYESPYSFPDLYPPRLWLATSLVSLLFHVVIALPPTSPNCLSALSSSSPRDCHPYPDPSAAVLARFLVHDGRYPGRIPEILPRAELWTLALFCWNFPLTCMCCLQNSVDPISMDVEPAMEEKTATPDVAVIDPDVDLPGEAIGPKVTADDGMLLPAAVADYRYAITPDPVVSVMVFES